MFLSKNTQEHLPFNKIVHNLVCRNNFVLGVKYKYVKYTYLKITVLGLCGKAKRKEILLVAW